VSDEEKAFQGAIHERLTRRYAKFACLEKVHFSSDFLRNTNFPAEINMDFKGRNFFLGALWISLASTVRLC
jgi:hypothetical protein